MARDSMLYEVCPLCDGTGKMRDPPPAPPRALCAGCLCKPLHVVPIGLTAGQVERMAARALAEQKRRCVLSGPGEG